MEIRRQGALKVTMDDPQICRPRRASRWKMPVLTGLALLGTCCAVAACTGPSQKALEVSAAVGRADAGLTAGPEGGYAPGSSAQLGLSTLERRRLMEAARQAFDATSGATTSYTVVPENIDAEPTTVSATPAGPSTSAPDGSTCRPIQLAASKNGRTTVGTLTFCQVAGSRDLKISMRGESHDPVRIAARQRHPGSQSGRRT
jgi:hypothetical protein